MGAGVAQFGVVTGVKVKVNLSLEQAMKTQKESIPRLFL
jgi:hypothetical protein